MKRNHIVSTAVLFAAALFCPFPVLAMGTKESTSTATDTSAARKRELVITDDRNVQVTLQVPVDKVATSPLPHPHIIAAVEGDLSKVVGASSMSVSAAKVSILGKMYPQFLSVDTSFLKGLKLNVEELVRVNPDVFFTDSALEGLDQLGAAGIPGIYMGLKQDTVSYGTGQAKVFSPKLTMTDWVKYTAAVFGKDKSPAFDIEKLWNRTEQEISDVIAKVPVEKRPRVLIMFQTKSKLVAGAGTFGHYWIARTGGINAAADLKGPHPAFVALGSFEDILRWDPEIVYLTNFENTMPEDLYANRIDGQDWSKVSAVIDRRVYRIPLGIYRWYPPSLDGPLMLKWLAQKNYPELFKYDMKKELREYFSTYHRYTLSDAEINAILEPASSGNL
jgi:iron complex transport system substrate-binding protein